MLATFDEFIKENPICAKFADNKDAKAVFEILNQKTNIIKMMEISEFNKPALAVCLREIEEFYDRQSTPTIDLTDDFTRNMIGRMVRMILYPYGYRVDKQREIPKKYKSKYFSSASCYISVDDTDNLRMVVNGDIMEVRRGDTSFTNFHLKYNIVFDDDDSYNTTAVTINGKRYPLHIPYGFRSPGNAHLVFLSEDYVWFCLSFDGHKGDMFVNDNEILKHLIKILNANERSNATWGEDISEDTIFEIISHYGEFSKRD